MTKYLPLYHFFTTLRSHKDFNLGLEEYFSLVEVFQTDKKYQMDAQQLLNLCRFLWLKPGQSENLFVSLFKQSFSSKLNLKDIEEDIPEELVEENNKDESNQNSGNEENENEDIDSEESEFDDDESKNEDETEELYLNIINKNIGKSVKTTTEEKLVEPYKIHLLDKHIVLKERQLKQRWRTLKKIVEGQLSDQIDISKTIKEIGQTGFLLQPIFQKEKINSASLMTLVDNQGSMIAFNGLTKAFIQTAEKGAKINNSVFYFKNLPKLKEDNSDFYLYKTPSHTTYSGLLKELKQQFFKQKDLAILIISDAGAARGSLNLDRLNATVQLLQVLKNFSFKIVWLNPVPADRWQSTTASLIKDFVPMLEANENGLKETVEILRGKTTISSQLFYEEMITD